jgi:hypothetical protein
VGQDELLALKGVAVGADPAGLQRKVWALASVGDKMVPFD